MDYQDGVYFGLPEDDYHAIPRLSASGLQNLDVSPGTFWANSWLNPDRPVPGELDEDGEPVPEETTKARQVGKAYHCARLEPERFAKVYRREPTKADFSAKGMLTSDNAVKAELKARGQTQTLANETVAERCQRLAGLGYEGTLFPLVKAEFAASLASGQIALNGKVYDQIEQDMERLHSHPELGPLLKGEPEVAILWTDPHGIPMKAKLDVLGTGHWTDLKTFDNTRGAPIEKALTNAVQYNRLHMQAVTYRDAVEAVRVGQLQVQGEATDAQRALVAAISMRPDELDCWFLFNEKGTAPNVLAKQFDFFMVPDTITNSWDTGATAEQQAAGHEATRAETQLFMRAKWDVRKAKDQFVLYSEAYTKGQPWFPLNARASFSDYDFSTYWLEGKV